MQSKKRRSRTLTPEEEVLLKVHISDDEAFSKFERDCNIRNLRPATIKYYKNELSSFMKSVEKIGINKPMTQLTKKDIEDVILHLKANIKTVSINTRIRALKSFFNFLHKNKLISKNPMTNIKQLRSRQRLIETLDDTEIEKVAKTIKNQNSFIGVRDLAIFILMIDTGIRLSELTGIEVDDIRGNKIIIKKTKNLLERTAYLSKRTQELLQRYLMIRGKLDTNILFVNIDNGPLKPRGIQNRFEKYKEQCKLTKQFSPHILRHTFAKNSIINGMDAFTLAKLLGHSDITVTRRYVNLWGDDLEEKAKKYSSINRLKI